MHISIIKIFIIFIFFLVVEFSNFRFDELICIAELYDGESGKVNIFSNSQMRIIYGAHEKGGGVERMNEIIVGVIFDVLLRYFNCPVSTLGDLIFFLSGNSFSSK